MLCLYQVFLCLYQGFVICCVYIKDLLYVVFISSIYQVNVLFLWKPVSLFGLRMGCRIKSIV